MTNTTTNPLEGESRASHQVIADSRARFAANMAKPQPAAAPVQSQPNAAAAEAAKAMQSAKNPDGTRKHTGAEIHAAWTRAYTTPPSSAPAAQPNGSYISGNPPPGQILVVRDGRVQQVPDPSYKPASAEPDQFGRASAELIEQLGPERAGQNDALNKFLAAVNPATGERYAKENPKFLENIERARGQLFDGTDIAGVIAATEASLAASRFTPEMSAHGYKLTAPPGIELDAKVLAPYMAAARSAGLTNDQLQALLDTHIEDNPE